MNGMRRRKQNTRAISWGGLSAALIVIMLYMTAVLRYNRLAVLSAASVLIALIFIKFGYKAAALVYGASSALAFLLTPEKTVPLYFLMFFGIYPLVKAAAEKKRDFIKEYIIKYAFFNLSGIIIYLIAKNVLLGEIDIRINMLLLIISAEILFFIYDRVFSMLITAVKRKTDSAIKF